MILIILFVIVFVFFFRDGVLKVTTFGERIVLSVLNGIISTMELQGEKSLKFDLQPPNEAASIAWQKGVAVGFYTVKRKGRLISPYSGEVWALNILDTVFVRRSYRCRGLGKAMLEDFLESHASEDVGLSFPVEYPMMKVCQQVLVSRKKDRERLWECEEPGYPSQRRNIWLAVNSMLLPPKTEKWATQFKTGAFAHFSTSLYPIPKPNEKENHTKCSHISPFLSNRIFPTFLSFFLPRIPGTHSKCKKFL